MPISPEEVDDLLASMEPSLVAHVPTPRPQTPRQTEDGLLASSPQDGAVTGSTKPTTPVLTHRLSTRPSDSSGSRISPSNTTALPLVAGSGSQRTLTLSPKMDAPMTETNVVPPELPAEVDALAASLQVEDGSPTLREDVAAMETELGESIALPPLLASTPKSFSSSVAHFSTSHHQLNQGGDGMKLTKHVSLGRLATTTESDSGIAPLKALQTLSPRDKAASKRRLTIGTHEISHHALERLGVNTEILKKEKGMKKLGISDVDLQRSDEIRKYSGIPLSLAQNSKPEIVFGFTREQLLRVKAINRLGTSEEEVMDEYSRRVSRLGMHEASSIVK